MPQNRHEVYIVTPGGLDQRGGMGRVVSNLVEAWNAGPNRPPLRVIDPWGSGGLARSVLAWIRALLAVLSAGLRGRVALLHIHMATGGSVLRKGTIVWLGAVLQVPVVLHLHGGRLDRSAWLKWAPARGFLVYTLRRASRVVVLGRHWRRFVVTALGMPSDRVLVIPNGVPDPGEPPASRDAGSLRLVFLGRMVEAKGLPELLQSLADPRLAGFDWSCSFAGDGELADARGTARSLGLEERCDFLGWLDQPDLGTLLAGSDALVLPSHVEGLPMSVLEAMAHGLAIIATRVGAIEDAITDGETGLLVSPGAPKELADAILALLTDHDLRRRLQAAARARFLQEFTVELFAARILQLYQACGLELTRPVDHPRGVPCERGL